MTGFLKYLLILGLLIGFSGFSQKYSYKKKFGTQKNTMYAYWGYNRAIFTKSTIHFSGSDYDFTLKSAAAKDRPSNSMKTYFNPKTFTVPQFNVRIGWLYKFRWDWSFGWDHMKYVMRDNQYLYINGFIDSSSNSLLNGTFTDDDGKIFIPAKALHYENTNGLNYITFQLTNTAPLYKTNNNKFAILRRLGGGVGMVLTQTDFKWDGVDYHSGFKLGGYGFSLHAGVRFDFFNRFFVQNNFASGFIHLPKNATIVRGSASDNDYANHKFVYASWEIVAGVLWYVRTKNQCDSCPDWH